MLFPFVSVKPSPSSQWSLIRSFVQDLFCISFVWLTSLWEHSHTKLMQKKSHAKLRTRLHWLERLGFSRKTYNGCFLKYLVKCCIEIRISHLFEKISLWILMLNYENKQLGLAIQVQKPFSQFYSCFYSRFKNKISNYWLLFGGHDLRL